MVAVRAACRRTSTPLLIRPSSLRWTEAAFSLALSKQRLCSHEVCSLGKGVTAKGVTEKGVTEKALRGEGGDAKALRGKGVELRGRVRAKGASEMG